MECLFVKVASFTKKKACSDFHTQHLVFEHVFHFQQYKHFWYLILQMLNLTWWFDRSKSTPTHTSISLAVSKLDRFIHLFKGCLLHSCSFSLGFEGISMTYDSPVRSEAKPIFSVNSRVWCNGIASPRLTSSSPFEGRSSEILSIHIYLAIMLINCLLIYLL